MLYQLIPKTFKVGKYSHAIVEGAKRRAYEATKRADDAEKQCMLLANELIEMKENSTAHLLLPCLKNLLLPLYKFLIYNSLVVN